MSEHNGSTDTVTRSQLSSAIELVQWQQRMAAPGGQATLDVFTHFVGNNAEMTIELTDFAGTVHGAFEDRLFSNRFTALRVPPAARTVLIATVKLPKHGLEMQSQPLLLTEPFTLTNARWDRALVARGDRLPVTADVASLPDGTIVEVSVWEHAADGAHEQLTRFPAIINDARVEAEWEFDYFGDLEAAVARGEPVQFFYRVRYAGLHIDSDLLKFLWIALELVGEDDTPVPGERYQVELPDRTVREGRLDAVGRAVEDGITLEGACKIFPDMDKEAWEKI